MNSTNHCFTFNFNHVMFFLTFFFAPFNDFWFIFQFQAYFIALNCSKTFFLHQFLFIDKIQVFLIQISTNSTVIFDLNLYFFLVLNEHFKFLLKECRMEVTTCTIAWKYLTFQFLESNKGKWFWSKESNRDFALFFSAPFIIDWRPRNWIHYSKSVFFFKIQIFDIYKQIHTLTHYFVQFFSTKFYLVWMH